MVLRRIAEPAHGAAQEHILIGEIVDGVHHIAVEQHEVGAAGFDPHIADRIEDLCNRASRWTLFSGGSDASPSSRLVATTLRAVMPGCDQLRNEFGRMLEIRIHHDHGAAPRMTQARAQRFLMARNCA